MPKVSVIVPVYKVEKYIGQCIESILSQTFKDFELILVDDGSPDSSGAICDQYAQKDSRIQVFHKENGGVSSARNYGIEKAKGEWLCFVDSDDIIFPSYLEDFGLDVTADIYMQGYVKMKKKQVLAKHDFKRCQDRDFFGILSYSELNCIINSPCFKLYKRSIIQLNNIQFDYNTSYGEDHLFSLQYVMHCHSIHFSNATGYVYRISETESLTQRLVPYKEITYYALTAKKYHDSLCFRDGGQAFRHTVGMTLMTNYIRTLRYLCISEYSYMDYKWIRDNYKPEMSAADLDILPIRYKLLKKITCSFLYPFLYPIIKYIV